MSDNSKIEVSVNMHCARREKDYAVKLPLAEAQPFIERLETKKQYAQQVLEVFEKLGESAPDLVVSYRGQTYVLPAVHPKNDESVHRLVNDLLQKDVYTLKEPKARGPRKSAGDETEADTKKAAE